jgi:hypothetical protein
VLTNLKICLSDNRIRRYQQYWNTPYYANEKIVSCITVDNYNENQFSLETKCQYALFVWTSKIFDEDIPFEWQFSIIGRTKIALLTHYCIKSYTLFIKFCLYFLEIKFLWINVREYRWGNQKWTF